MADPHKIDSIDNLEPVFDTSHTKPVLIFKHSLTCPISSAAFREYETFLKDCEEGGSVEYHLVEVQNAREVSDAIETRSGIRHESPQAILFRDGQPVWHASHFAITAKSLADAVQTHGE